MLAPGGANGNMVQDDNKNIASIVYNHLNLPTRINFVTGNKIEYLYNAVGQKVEKKVFYGTSSIRTDYMDGFQYTNSVLNFFPHAEGYVNAIGDPTSYKFFYVYNYTDHLGNIRASYGKDPDTGVVKILEENHYYPFGLKHTNYNGGKKKFAKEEQTQQSEEYEIKQRLAGEYIEYKYKYQGQERQDELGLNWDSFKWRNYDYAIGRFMSVDPLAEDYVYNSPYAFAENRVVDGRELEGLEWTSSTSSDGKTVNLNLNVRTVNNTNGSLTNAQVATLASERALVLNKTIGGTDAQNRNVIVTVCENENATMVWEYNTVLSADGVIDDTGNTQKALGGALGVTNEVGNTQNNGTQVNVAQPNNMGYIGDTNLADFDDKNSSSATATTGNHEDAHTLGLRHDDDPKNANGNEQAKDRNNLMNNNDANGRNISAQQRSQVIKLIEQQQPKQ